MKTTVLHLLPFLLFACAHAAPAPRNPLLDSVLEETVAAGEPGVAVLVVKDGTIVYDNARGVSSLDSAAPLKTDTPIYIASIAKEFTAAAILRLAERRQLALDDEISTHVPEVQSFAGGVTIRHLLTHTGGFVDYFDVMKDQVQGWTNKDVLALLRKENRLLFPPGSKASYSNSGYVVLAMAVERISGRPFEDFLRREIFQPAGMKQTKAVTCPGLLPRGAARGYRRSEDGVWKEHGYDSCTTGSGGIVSTAADLVRWVDALESGRIISNASLQEASRPAMLTDGRPTAYGFGWLAEFDAKGPLANVWYTASFGDLNGYKGMLKRIPDRKLTMVVLTNRGVFPWKILETIHRIYA